MSGYELASADAPPLGGRGPLEFVLKHLRLLRWTASTTPRGVPGGGRGRRPRRGCHRSGRRGLGVLVSEGYVPGGEKACDL